MNKKIFVVVNCSGAHDDYFETMERGFTTFEQAQAHVLKLQAQIDRQVEIGPELVKKFRAWIELHHPVPAMEKLEQAPRMEKGWKSNDIPAEFKRETGRIQRENHARASRSRAAQLKWEFVATEKCQELLAEFNVPEDERDRYEAPFWHFSNSQVSYDIRELEIGV